MLLCVSFFFYKLNMSANENEKSSQIIALIVIDGVAIMKKN